MCVIERACLLNRTQRWVKPSYTHNPYRTQEKRKRGSICSANLKRREVPCRCAGTLSISTILPTPEWKKIMSACKLCDCADARVVLRPKSYEWCELGDYDGTFKCICTKCYASIWEEEDMCPPEELSPCANCGVLLPEGEIALSCTECEKHVCRFSTCVGLSWCQSHDVICRECFDYICFTCNVAPLPKDRVYVEDVEDENDNAPICESCKKNENK